MSQHIPPADNLTLHAICERLDRMEQALHTLLSQHTRKDWYEVEEVASLLDKAPFTVREWCRNGRVNARKKKSGRGKHPGWVISHDELQRIQREGLLPPHHTRIDAIPDRWIS